MTARAPSSSVAPPFASRGVESIPLGPFRLESGEELPELVVAYRHDGPPPGAAPQAVVVHALTGSADAAGDWWAPLVGLGRALDTRSTGVLCANLLGGCYGTTGPTTPDPRTGKPLLRGFPAVTVRDQARAQWRLLDALGVESVALVTGGSLGGMVSLEIGLERPAAVDTVLPIAAPAAIGALALAWDHVQLELVERLGVEGLDLARRLALTTYRSEIDFDGRFGRGRQRDGQAAIVSYLAHQGGKLVNRFDPDTYRVLVGAMDRHDIGAGRGGVEPALARLASAGVRLTGIGIAGDLLYGPAQVEALVAAAAAAGVAARYREIESTKGHDAFLVEWGQLGEIVSDALEASTSSRAAPALRLDG